MWQALDYLNLVDILTSIQMVENWCQDVTKILFQQLLTLMAFGKVQVFTNTVHVLTIKYHLSYCTHPLVSKNWFTNVFSWNNLYKCLLVPLKALVTLQLVTTYGHINIIQRASQVKMGSLEFHVTTMMILQQ